MSKKTFTPLRNLRRARSLNQTDLARIVEVSQQTISKAERGLLNLTPDVQTRIATVLGASRQELFPTATNDSAVAS